MTGTLCFRKTFPMDNLIEDLKALIASGVTQTAIAEASDVTLGTLNRFIHGIHDIGYSKALRLRRAVEKLRMEKSSACNKD